MEKVLEGYFNRFHWILWILLVIASVVWSLFSWKLLSQSKISRKRSHLAKEKERTEEEDTDEGLERRAKAAEEQIVLISQELESMDLYERTGSDSVKKNADFLWRRLREVCEGKKNLAIRVSSEIQSRKKERSLAIGALSLIEKKLESRTKMLEIEKNDMQKKLEKEIDRRSNEWASVLEKFRAEERKMRGRIKDLGGKNVKLAREVSSLNKEEIHAKKTVMDDLRNKLKDAEDEMMKLREILSESVNKAKQAEDERDSNKRILREKERENSELQKSVVRLQRLCRNQETTIGGLWLQLDNDVNNNPQAKDRDVRIIELQKEQLRLVGIEHGLRKDLENCRLEAEALRKNNGSLLEKVRSKEKSSSIGLIKLDQEFWDFLHTLQAQAFPLLDENVQLSFKLLGFVKRVWEINEGEHSKGMLASGQERDHVLELDIMAQSLRKRVESWKESVHRQEEILKEKSHISCGESLKEDSVENSEACQQEQQHIENEEGFKQVQHELRAENLLVKILREKLFSNAIDIEQLQAECTILVRGQEVLRSNIESVQGSLSSSNQKEKELENQLAGKENTIKSLQVDLQECLKELAVVRGEVAKVSKERDEYQRDA